MPDRAARNEPTYAGRTPLGASQRRSRGSFRGRMTRRLRVHRSGWVVCGSSLVLGVAAIATGNNLLFLMLGGMLGLIALSGWMSERSLRHVEVSRRVPVGVFVGQPALIVYEVARPRGRTPSFALEISEAGLAERAFVPLLEARGTARPRLAHTFAVRGVHQLDRIVLSTGFPFGLFSKERDIREEGEVVVWPRVDRVVRELRSGGTRHPRSASAWALAPGARGEFRGLREYRPGDDPRDVHWRSSARRVSPVVREYERDGGDTLWLCLDLRARPGARAELTCEIAAALAARAHSRGQVFGLVTANARVPLGSGAGQLERVLDVLARARFRLDAPAVQPPGDGVGAVLITALEAGAGEWADVYSAVEAT
jgi:uncharacterized protein (DUF58 family)